MVNFIWNRLLMTNIVKKNIDRKSSTSRIFENFRQTLTETQQWSEDKKIYCEFFIFFCRLHSIDPVQYRLRGAVQCAKTIVQVAVKEQVKCIFLKGNFTSESIDFLYKWIENSCMCEYEECVCLPKYVVFFCSSPILIYVLKLLTFT